MASKALLALVRLESTDRREASKRWSDSA
jgi:hypothetical protein